MGRGRRGSFNRGGSSRGGGGRGGSRGKFRNHGARKPNTHSKDFSKNKRSFTKDSEEANIEESNNKRQKLQAENKRQIQDEESSSSSSDSEQGERPYTQLLSLFKGSSKAEQVVTSSEDEEEEEENSDAIPDSENGQESGEDLDSLDEEGEEEEEAEELLEDEELLEEEEEDELEEETEPEETSSSQDNFHAHFEKELDENLLAILSSPKPYENKELQWKSLGRMVVSVVPKTDLKVNNKLTAKPLLEEALSEFVVPACLPVLKSGVPLKEFGVKQQLCTNFDTRPLSDGNQQIEDVLTPLQHEIFSLAQEYRDLYYPEMTHMNCSEIRDVYCLHALNHVLKSRDKVLAHNEKLKKARLSGVAVQEEYRDQGLVRPRVLIITPLRNSAVKIVEKLASLLLPKNGQTINQKRFYEEFGEETDVKDGDEAKKEEKEDVKKSRKPEDFEAIFSGNNDDSFRIGISVAKRSLKLYTGFYMSDILIASPLGLRTLLAEEFDFLSSIEVLIMDQTDILYMQNWDHVLQVFQHLHLQPREQRGTDLSRVRLWALNGQSAHYRQNLIFSCIALPEISAIFSRKGTNFSGKVRIENAVPSTSASVCRVVVQLPQAFHRFSTTTAAQSSEDRFQFFTKKILPQFRDAIMTNTLIYVPSYYDYVRLRNYLHKEEVNFGQACEYTPDGKLAQVRNRFFLGKKRILLYTERLHFFRRLTIKGIHHIVFYQLPSYPHFYAELSNLLQEAYQSKKYRGDSSQTCTVLYSTFDAQRLSAVVGSQRAAEMLTSDRPVHLFVSGRS